MIAVASILYGSVMAFTQTSARLILGYSSVAQLGFITLGIFSLRPDGADGAVLQMVNHGLVVAPLMLISVLLVARAGTDDITKMGGLAMRAPVLAALFLIVTMALLAIPGSSNFIGEFYILNGIFQEKIVYAFVAAIGIALAAYYALRLYQHAMHNRKPDGIESREIGWRDGGVVTGLVACIVGAGALSRPDPAPGRGLDSRIGRRLAAAPPDAGGRAMNFNAPHIDYSGLSPVHRAHGGDRRRPDGRAAAAYQPLHDRGPDDRGARGHGGTVHHRVEHEPEPGRRRAPARRLRPGRQPDRLHGRRGRRPPLDPRARRGGGDPRRLLLAAARLGAGHDPDRAGAEPGRLLRRARAALDPALRALRLGPPARSARSSRASST